MQGSLTLRQAQLPCKDSLAGFAQTSIASLISQELGGLPNPEDPVHTHAFRTRKAPPLNRLLHHTYWVLYTLHGSALGVPEQDPYGIMRLLAQSSRASPAPDAGLALLKLFCCGIRSCIVHCLGYWNKSDSCRDRAQFFLRLTLFTGDPMAALADGLERRVPLAVAMTVCSTDWFTGSSSSSGPALPASARQATGLPCPVGARTVDILWDSTRWHLRVQRSLKGSRCTLGRPSAVDLSGPEAGNHAPRSSLT